MSKAKAVRGALSALTDIFKKGDDAPIDESKRRLLKGAAAAPILGLGALAGVKVGSKLVEDAPAVVEAVSEIPRISSYNWINELYSQFPKLRQMVGRDIQKEFIDTDGIEEMIKAGYEPHWFDHSPSSYEKVFKEFAEDQHAPVINFNLMGDDFTRDLNKFLIGEQPNKGGLFSEFSDAYKKDWKLNFPEDDVLSKEFEVGQREFFMKQLFSEGIEESSKFNLDAVFKKIGDDREYIHKLYDIE